MSHYVVTGIKRQKPVAVAKVVRGKSLSGWNRDKPGLGYEGNPKAVGIYTTRLRRAALFPTYQEAAAVCTELNDYQDVCNSYAGRTKHYTVMPLAEAEKRIMK